MRTPVRRLDLWIGIALAALYGVGVVLHLLPATSTMVQGLTPGVLLLTAALTCVPLFRDGAGPIFVWIAASFLVGFLLEVIGVATGVIFGSYAYGEVLGVKLMSVPVVIGLNWAFVILGATALATRVTKNPVLAAVFAGALTTGFDWVMEPVAVATGYWRWSAEMIPLRNYIAWFVISGVLSFALASQKRKPTTWVPAIAFLLQLAFFFALRMTL